MTPDNDKLKNNEIDESYTIPDGGYGWVQVGVSFINQFMLIGLINIYGIYQEQYMKLPMFVGASAMSVSFIGSLASAGLVAYGTLAGYLCRRIGYRNTCYTGGLICCLSLVLTSFARAVWQFHLCQGVLFGLGSSIVYFPSLGIISHWFDKKKGLASGLAISGAGLGGLCLGPIVQLLLTNVGLEWTLRLTGITAGVCVISASSLLCPRFASGTSKPLDYRAALSDAKMVLFCFAGIFYSLAFVPFYFTPLFAVQHGFTTGQGSLLEGMLCGAFGGIGLVVGTLGDSLGYLNLVVCTTLLAGLTAAFLWPIATSFGLLCAFVVTYGVFAGALYALLPSAIVATFGTDNIVSVTGLIYSTGIVGSGLGPPFGGYLLDKFAKKNGNVTEYNFLPTMYLTGGCMISAALIFLTIRILGMRRKEAESSQE
jgi:MFS family permease